MWAFFLGLWVNMHWVQSYSVSAKYQTACPYLMGCCCCCCCISWDVAAAAAAASHGMLLLLLLHLMGCCCCCCIAWDVAAAAAASHGMLLRFHVLDTSVTSCECVYSPRTCLLQPPYLITRGGGGCLLHPAVSRFGYGVTQHDFG